MMLGQESEEARVTSPRYLASLGALSLVMAETLDSQIWREYLLAKCKPPCDGETEEGSFQFFDSVVCRVPINQ